MVLHNVTSYLAHIMAGRVFTYLPRKRNEAGSAVKLACRVAGQVVQGYMAVAFPRA